MAATEKHCSRQVRRMGGLDGYPAETEARVELVVALVEACGSDEHATRVISAVMAECTRTPKPADLRAMARSLAEERARSGCERCIEGWVYDAARGGVRRCECNRKAGAA